MNSRHGLDDRVIDALLRGHALEEEPVLSEAVAALLLLADRPVPVPSMALAAMLDNGVLPDASPSETLAVRRTRRGWVRAGQCAAAGVASVALVVGAAAADQLPAPVQTRVADVVATVTSVHLPRPHHAPTTPATTPPVSSIPARPAPVNTHGAPSQQTGEHGTTQGDDHHGDGTERRRGDSGSTETKTGGDGPTTDGEVTRAPTQEPTQAATPDSRSGSDGHPSEGSDHPTASAVPAPEADHSGSGSSSSGSSDG